MFERNCPNCGIRSRMKHGFCGSCKIFAPKDRQESRRTSMTKLGTWAGAFVVGNGYSMFKDALLAVKPKSGVVSHNTDALLVKPPPQAIASDSVKVTESVSVKIVQPSPFHGTFVYGPIVPDGPGNQHHGQV